MDNGYTLEIEDILEAYAIEAECLYVIHNKNYLLYRKRGYYYTIPVIVISTITGVLSFNQSIQATIIGQYSIGSLNIICGIASTVYKFLNYSNFENQHKILAVEYLHLFEDIRGVLQKKSSDRQEALGYLTSVEKKRQELLENFSIINDDIRKSFKHKHKGITLPLKLNHISNVHIYGREPKHAKVEIESQTSSEKSNYMV